MTDYYDTLGLGRDATDVELKQAYRKLAMQHHPDRNPGDKASEERFKQINEAYSCLSDPEKKSNYDRFGAAESGPGAGFSGDFGDIFSDIFGDFFGGFRGQGRARSTRGRDLRLDLGIDLNQAAEGVEKVVDITRWQGCEDCGSTGSSSKVPVTCTDCKGTGQIRFQQGFFSVARTCSRCRGQGKVLTDPCPKCKGQARIKVVGKVSVKIPAGVDSGSRLKMTGEGEPGSLGGPPGDLYIVMDVEEHDFFKRDGSDLYCQVPVTFAQAALGAEIEVPTLTGAAKMKIPAGTQPGDVLSLKGMGVPSLRTNRKGDQFVMVNLVVPKRLSRKQKDLVREFDKHFGEDVLEGFRKKVKEIFKAEH